MSKKIEKLKSKNRSLKYRVKYLEYVKKSLENELAYQKIHHENLMRIDLQVSKIKELADKVRTYEQQSNS